VEDGEEKPAHKDVQRHQRRDAQASERILMWSEKNKPTNPFGGESIGIVLARENLDEDRYRILIRYSRRLEREIRPGTLLAAENYQSGVDGVRRYSVLQVESCTPIHYALGPNADKLESEYPGFVISSAVSAAADWEQEEPREETTQIRVVAYPIGRMLVVESAGSQFYVAEDISSPKQGAYVNLLSKEAAEIVLNGELMKTQRSIKLATLLEPLEGVSLHIDPLELVRTHFGIFGFTKAGKSNVASTIAEKIIRASLTSTWLRNIRLLIFDYMNEYFPLLADLFADNQLKSGCYVMTLDEEWGATLAGTSTREASRLLLQNMTMPDELRRLEGSFLKILDEAMSGNRLRVYTPTRVDPVYIANRLSDVLNRYRHIKSLTDILHILDTYPAFFQSLSHSNVNENQLIQICRTVVDRLSGALAGRRTLCALSVPEKGSTAESSLDSFMTARQRGSTVQIFNEQLSVQRIPDRTARYLLELRDVLNDCINKIHMISSIPVGYRLDVEGLIRIINDVKNYPGPWLFIIISEHPDLLREFFARVGDALYNERRRKGLSAPPVLFIVDEADEFVGAAYGESGTPPSMGESRSTAETIARRGRKLGIGIGIATQRVAYIDTKLMGQLHTYFVSKLPRRSDRERVAEAFGVSLGTIDRTLALRSPRQWLVISHSSVELHSTPYFVTFESRVQYVREAVGRRGA
jgi:hypothetical protein